MTEFKKVTVEIEKLGKLCEQISDDINSESEIERSSGITKYELFSQSIESLVPRIARFRMRLAEKDPEKQTYTEGMKEKIKKLVHDYDDLYEIYQESMKPKLDDMLLRLVEFRKEQEEQKKAEKIARQMDLIAKGQLETHIEETQRQKKLQQIRQQEELQQEKSSALQQQLLEKQKALAEKIDKQWMELLQIEASLDSSRPERRIEHGISMLLALNTSLFDEYINTLLDFVSSIFAHPEIVSRRLVRISNAQFQKKIGNFNGNLFVLRAIGFEWKDYSSIKDLIQENNLYTDSQEDISKETFLYLEEPSIEADFNEWKKWHCKIDCCRRVLQRCAARMNPIKGKFYENASVILSSTELRDIVDDEFVSVLSSASSDSDE